MGHRLVPGGGIATLAAQCYVIDRRLVSPGGIASLAAPCYVIDRRLVSPGGIAIARRPMLCHRPATGVARRHCCARRHARAIASLRALAPGAGGWATGWCRARHCFARRPNAMLQTGDWCRPAALLSLAAIRLCCRPAAGAGRRHCYRSPP